MITFSTSDRIFNSESFWRFCVKILWVSFTWVHFNLHLLAVRIKFPQIYCDFPIYCSLWFVALKIQEREKFIAVDYLRFRFWSRDNKRNSNRHLHNHLQSISSLPLSSRFLISVNISDLPLINRISRNRDYFWVLALHQRIKKDCHFLQHLEEDKNHCAIELHPSLLQSRFYCSSLVLIF